MNRSEIDIRLKDYELLYNAFYSSGGFRSGDYLIKHKRESDEKYNARKRLSYYLNYVAPTLNQHINAIFSKNIYRESNNIIYNAFLDDVDCNQTYINDFMKKAAIEAKLYGVTYIVIDNISQEDQPASLSEAMANRSFPFAYTVTPDKIEDIQTDKFGNLISFSFREKIDYDETNDIDYNIHTFTDKYIEYKDIINNKIIHIEHNLGAIPVIEFKSRQTKELIPTSEFLSIAKTNLHIFNLCSWLTEILQNQAFSILTYPIDSIDDSNNNTLTIGVNNAFSFPSDSQHTPEFIAPPATPAQMITDQIDRLIKEIYRQAGLAFMVGIKQESSGISKAYDFEQLNQILSDFATNIESTEYKMANIFFKYLNTSNADKDINELIIIYKKNYNLSDINSDINNAEQILNLNNVNSPTLTKCVIKKLINSYLNDDNADIDDDIKNNILKEVEDSIKNNNIVNYLNNNNYDHDDYKDGGVE